MKKIIFPFIFLVFASFIVADTPLTQAERDIAISEMTKTQNLLLTTVQGLSQEQLNFKSSPESWSIAECAEHIALSETNIFGMLEGTIQTPADPSKRDEVKITDEQLMQLLVDRSNKVKTFAGFEPSGKFGSMESILSEFQKLRKQHIEYVGTTQDDLRNRYAQLPFGTIDAYQILLFMSAHTERHVLQMKEVMADENFPKM